MNLDSLRRGLAASLFLLGVDAAYNIMGGSNSSPQTTEVFGKGKRGRTLMKWVWIADLKILLYTGFASLIAPKGARWWPLVGGMVVATEMHSSYVYAARCAARSDGPTGDTIDYGAPTQPGVTATVRPR